MCTRKKDVEKLSCGFEVNLRQVIFFTLLSRKNEMKVNKISLILDR